KKIIEFREKNQFKKIEEIKNVDGIGDKTFESLKSLITID
ncbi:MAG: helix-hairpin-helix domain-containing protein, partial [Finegoldia magna]|nr:helix-hairpin-helix domain-containing protein [Finegoldia magna]